MNVNTKGQWMVETLKRLQLDDLDEPTIGRSPRTDTRAPVTDHWETNNETRQSC